MKNKASMATNSFFFFIMYRENNFFKKSKIQFSENCVAKE